MSEKGLNEGFYKKYSALRLNQKLKVFVFS